MPHYVHKWRPIHTKDIQGSDIEVDEAAVIDLYYRGRLAAEILKMAPQKPMSFEHAIDLAMDKKNEAFNARRFGDEPGGHGWYSNHFVEWISSLGYHIELTGDEFDVIFPSRQAA